MNLSETTPRLAIIQPIAFDLAFDDSAADGMPTSTTAGLPNPFTRKVICGPGTKKACDHAIRVAEKLRKQGIRPLIFVSATVPRDPKWCGVVMGLIMADYIKQQGVSPKEIFFHEARTFNTMGEVNALADTFAGQFTDDDPLLSSVPHSVHIVVKWWHAPRVWMLTKWALRRRRCSTLPVRLHLHRINCGWRALAQEPVSIVANIVRMLRGG